MRLIAIVALEKTAAGCFAYAAQDFQGWARVLSPLGNRLLAAARRLEA